MQTSSPTDAMTTNRKRGNGPRYRTRWGTRSPPAEPAEPAANGTNPLPPPRAKRPQASPVVAAGVRGFGGAPPIFPRVILRESRPQAVADKRGGSGAYPRSGQHQKTAAQPPLKPLLFRGFGGRAPQQSGSRQKRSLPLFVLRLKSQPH